MDTISQLRCGSWVRVKPLTEIRTTLDAGGMLDGLPFMDEMAEFCGKVFRVRSRPGKTCVDARPMEMRAFAGHNVFLLDGVRCSGVAHGGCERDCLVFWRREWLESVPGPCSSSLPLSPPAFASAVPSVSGEGAYICQSTTLRRATKLISWRDRIGVLLWDWWQGNLNLAQVLFQTTRPLGRKVLRRFRGTWPRGWLRKTPTVSLGLNAGDLVRVRPKSEIMATLDTEGRNRGLVFEPDMLAFCGQILKVRRRVTRIIMESTGKMITMNNTVTLEDVVCSCPFTFGGCPRAELQLWREIWLELYCRQAENDNRESQAIGKTLS